MKRPLLLTLLCFFALTRLFAQASSTAMDTIPFATMDTININNIGAAQLVHGDMWWNPATGLRNCEFPTDSGKNINGAGATWMSGYDGSGQLHIAAQTYRQTGNDYWPGPLISDTLTYAQSQNWAKIWKVNSTDIQSFLSLHTHTLANTPQSILTWPGKGNIHATGNDGALLTISNDMAPFVDLNGDGSYEPLLGEYPDIKGDQAIWWVFSDNGPTHNQTNGMPLDVEVHAMAYAYKRGTLIDDVVYYEYSIVNRSPNTYTDFRIAQWTRISLGVDGLVGQNYLGFDSVWRMGIIYNANNDDAVGGGFPPVTSYGLNPPQSAITMIVLPGDTSADYVPPGSFIYYDNDASVIGNPTVDTQYSNYMRAKMLNGQHYTNDSGQNCNYVFPGDPSDTVTWSECSSHDNTGTRCYVFASNDVTLNAGSTQKVVFALLVADTLAGGCPVATFNGISIVADTAWADYYNPPPQLYITSPPATNNIQIYPNPVSNQLYIVNNCSTGDEYIAIYNSLGQKIDLTITQNGTGNIVDVSSLPPAMYYIVYRKDNVQKTAKFVKE